MTNDTKVSWLSLSKIHTILKVYLWLYAIAVVFILIYLLLIGFLTLEGQPYSLTDVLVKIFALLVLEILGTYNYYHPYIVWACINLILISWCSNSHFPFPLYGNSVFLFSTSYCYVATIYIVFF
jgi:hypothetical protein